MEESVPKPPAPEEKKENKYPIEVDKPPVVTEHRLGSLEYTATAGMLPIRSELGEVEAGIFYVAYTKKGESDPSRRPLTFSFNGGPGSSSVWLHLGVVGPKRVALQDDGWLPPPPFRLVDNDQSWLQHSDLVFIDPVGTGYSRPATKELGDKFWGLKGDIESVGEFIRMYLARNDRWSSPLFLVGESYGTTRAAGLSGHLIDKGIAFNGITLVSSILNFQTARFAKGNDLPNILFLPSYTATAWYHKRLPEDLQKNLAATLEQVEKWASTDYILALSKGDRLTQEERTEVIRMLSRFTGLKPEFIDNSDLRINIHRFCKELLRDEKRTVGRLDSRYKGIEQLAVGDTPSEDPAGSILPAYAATLNDYLGRILGYKTDLQYHVFAPNDPPLYKKWDWGSAGQGYPDTSESMRKALSQNPHMKVFIASCFFDLATPYFATEYTLAHMELDPTLRNNISTGEYEAGHMMYVHNESLGKMQSDVAKFYASALGS